VYDRIILQLGGTFTKAQITEVRIKANGKIIFQDSGSRIDSRMQYRGIAANAALLTLDFTEIRAKDQLEQLMGGLDTSKNADGSQKVSSLIMEVDIGAATAPTLTAYLQASYQDTQVRGTVDLIGKVLLYTFPCSGTASKFPLQIPFGKQGGSLIKRIHLVATSGTITVNGVTINKDSAPIHDTVAAVNQFIQTEYQRTPQAGIYTVDFIPDGNMNANILNAADATSMEYYADVTVTVAGNLTAVVEMLDPLSNN
jgi:hypothetical protein